MSPTFSSAHRPERDRTSEGRHHKDVDALERKLELRTQELEEEVAKYKDRSLSAEKRERRLQQELQDLQTQYDSMRSDGEKAAECLRRERRTFYGVHRWLFVEPYEKNGAVDGELRTKEAQKRNAHRRRELLQEFGPGLAKLLNVDLAALEEAAHEVDKAKASGPPPQTGSRITGSNTHPPNVSPQSGESTKPPSHLHAPGQGLLQSNHEPTIFLPVTSKIDQESMQTPKPAKLRRAPIPFNSSDTEDDTQAPSSQSDFKVPLPIRDPITRRFGNSSDTEEDSQGPSSPACLPPETPAFDGPKLITGRIMRPTLPSRPAISHMRRQSDNNISTLRLSVKTEPEDDSDALQTEPPTKKPRVSLDASFKTPPRVGFFFSPQRAFSTGQITRGKRRYEDENTPIGKVPNVAPTSVKLGLEDYSMYKGRGRYARADETSTRTLNALFTINPELNGGATHQYEEVVRGRQDRVRMDAGDCECCRDYYAAVGPLPPRDQGPLWRSPSTTPVKAKFCKRHSVQTMPLTRDRNATRALSPDRLQTEIEAHKKAVSRHRHNWARPQTPPSYWSIGFPDTQEAREINKRAEVMHREKLKLVEREVERGRYIRR